MKRIVILAAGRGTRMRREAPGVRLDPDQERLAAEGLKGLIPIHGRPYLDYVLGAAADAGLTEVCLVVSPGPNPIREHYESRRTVRVQIHFAVQDEPRGSADALLAAREFAGEEPFAVINSDNYYPPSSLASLRMREGSGMVGFRRAALITAGGIPPLRIAAYALVTTDAEGYLSDIIEKPNVETLARLAGSSWISMTCWRFEPSIFEACRSIPRSARGEYELPDAVRHAARSLGVRFFVQPSDEPVLDLSGREDVAIVSERLKDVEVEP